MNQTDNLDKIELDYQINATQQKLYSFAANHNDDNHLVYSKITKGEAKDLYDKGLLGRKEGKVIYDKLVSQAIKCPYCGEIGFVASLDHYLPKSFFPQFSILPYNLIPSCRDCNSGSKGSGYPIQEEEQIIHPYFDKPIFFEDQWIYADVITSINQEDPYILKYYVSCPDGWNDIDKRRAKKHFDKFKIAKRYAINASEELSIVVDARKNTLKNLSELDYQSYLLEQSGIHLHINHWRKVMYQALANNTIFCASKI